MKALLSRLLPFIVIASVVALPACEAPDDTDPGDDVDTTAMDQQDIQQTAVAMLEPTEGNDVRGTVNFMQMDNGVHVTATLTGLSEGEHGFHVHEVGDCSAPDASSAGGHFNPDGSPHGAPTDAEGERHAGDLGNIEADADGNAQYERVDEVMTMSGPNSIVGKAVVVHADEDDLESQPSGDAGDRLACGVIQLEGEGTGTTGGMGGAGGAGGEMQSDTAANF